MNTLRAYFEHEELARLRRELANEKALRLAAEAARGAQEQVARFAAAFEHVGLPVPR